MLPVAATPIPDGAVAFVDGVIVACGPADDVIRRYPDIPKRDLGDALVSPGFVDAHCHLEWSLLDGLLPPGPFARWLGEMLPIRGRYPPGANVVAARLGALRCLEHGTTTLVDSGPTGAGAAAMDEAGLRGVAALEVVGREAGPAAQQVAARTAARLEELEAEVGDRIAVGIAPHAPYSVGPELWAALSAHPGIGPRVMTSHVAESTAEAELLADGTGPMAELFSTVGIQPGRWDTDAQSTPVARLRAHGALDALNVAAHCVQLGPGDEAMLAKSGVAVAHCPRSNRFLECGVAPVRALGSAGVTVALGSDSPASGGLYDIRAETRAAADVAASTDNSASVWSELHEMATRAGASALGLPDTGQLVAGAAADLVAIRPPDGASCDADPARAILGAAGKVIRVAVAGETLLDESGPAQLDASSVVAAANRARAALC